MRGGFFLAVLLGLAWPALAAPDAAQLTAICHARATCEVTKTDEAGRSPAGVPLGVVEVHLGLADKPDDQDRGCINGNDRDGGVEYWLLEGTTAPRRILKLCNDGYGISGVGEDHVEVGPNRLSHHQYGGSAWRWVSDVTYTLSPFRAVHEQDCSYHNANEASGTALDLDFRTRVVRSLAKDSTQNNPGMGCAEWPARFAARAGDATLGAYPVIAPWLGEPSIPAGTAIGDCVVTMTTSGENGFAVWGTPAPANRAAEIKVLAVGWNILYVQVFDPLATSAAAGPTIGTSWINLPHLEVWVGHNDENLRTMLPLGQLSQVGIDLSGGVHRGVGKADAPVPEVERWQARDERGRPVVALRITWPGSHPLLNGVALAYSQAENGKQARLVATTGIVNNRPLYVPEIVSLSDTQGRGRRCQVRDGRLSVAD